jgi:hypothetical protein
MSVDKSGHYRSTAEVDTKHVGTGWRCVDVANNAILDPDIRGLKQNAGLDIQHTCIVKIETVH